MNGLALVIIVGQLPKLFGFSTDAEGFGAEIKAFFLHLNDTVGAALAVGLVVLAILFVLPRLTKRLPAVLVAIVVGHRDLGRLRAASRTACRRWAPCHRAAAAIAAVDQVLRHRAAHGRGGRHHARLAGRHHRHLLELRRPAGRGGRSQPGDDRHRGRQPGVGLPAGLRRLHERLADRRRRAGRGQVATGLGRRRRRRRRAAPVLQLAAGGPSAIGAGRRADRRRRLAARPQRAAPVLAGAQERVRPVAGRESGGRSSSACCRASSSPSRWRCVLFFQARLEAARHVLGAGRRLHGWHSVEALPRRAQVPGIVVYRWEAPLFFANCSALPHRRSASSSAERDAVLGGVRVRRPSPTSTSRPPRCSSDSISSSTTAARTWPSSRCGRRLQYLVQRYGLYETIDRDRFYPTLEEGLEVIRAEEGGAAPPS